MSLNSLQDDMSRRAASMAAMAKRANNPQDIQAIQKSLVAGVQNGSIQPYVGIPLIQELTRKLMEAKSKMAAAMAGGDPMQAAQQSPVAQQVMQRAAQEEQGLAALQSNLPQDYAGGGIIAFTTGGGVERGGAAIGRNLAIGGGALPRHAADRADQRFHRLGRQFLPMLRAGGPRRHRTGRC